MHTNSAPIKAYRNIRDHISRMFEENLSEIKNDKRKEGRSTGDNSSVSDSEDLGDVTPSDENSMDKQQKGERSATITRRKGNPARCVGFSRVKTGLKDKTPREECVESGVEAAEFSENMHRDLASSEMDVRTTPTRHDDNKDAIVVRNKPLASTWLRSKEKKLDAVFLQLLQRLIYQLAYRSIIFFAVTFCFYRFTPLPDYLLGFAMGIFATITLYNTTTNVKKILTTLPNEKLIRQTAVPVLEIPAVKEHVVVERFEGWLNELPYSYEPDNYHVARTKSVFFRLEGDILRIMETRMKIPKRAVWDEPRHKLKFTKRRVYSLNGAKVDLLPQGLIRRRRWSKKYPICITLKKEALISNITLRSTRNDECATRDDQTRRTVEKRKGVKKQRNRQNKKAKNEGKYKTKVHGDGKDEGRVNILEEGHVQYNADDIADDDDDDDVDDDDDDGGGGGGGDNDNDNDNNDDDGDADANGDGDEDEDYEGYEDDEEDYVYDDNYDDDEELVKTDSRMGEREAEAEAEAEADEEEDEEEEEDDRDDDGEEKKQNEKHVARMRSLRSTFQDCREDDESDAELKIYIFARADRQKEDWYRRLALAASRRSKKDDSLPLPSEHATSVNVSLTSQSGMAESRISALPNNLCENVSELSYNAYMAKYLGIRATQASASATGSTSTSTSTSALTSEGEPSTFFDNILWFNCLVGRVLFDMHKCPETTNLIQDKIQRKLSNIKLPYFMECLLVSEVVIGQGAPIISEVAKPLTDERGLWLNLNVTYKGSLTMTVETKLNLMKLTRTGSVSSNTSDVLSTEKHKPTARSPIFDSDVEDTPETSTEDEDTSRMQVSSTPKETTPAQSSGKTFLNMVDRIAANKYFQHAAELPYVRKAMEGISNTEIKLMVTVSGIEGCLCVNIPPAPSDRIWYGFKPVPKVSLTVMPAVGERTVNIVSVTKWIEAKLLREFEKLVVLPNMDDLVLPLCPNYPFTTTTR